MNATVRLTVADRPARRDALHGAWWPYSRDLDRELAPMLNQLAARFGKVIGVLLNRAEWPETPISWQPNLNAKVRISWYAVQEPGTAVVLFGGRTQLVLRVVPPETAEAEAVSSMANAAAEGRSAR